MKNTTILIVVIALLGLGAYMFSTKSNEPEVMMEKDAVVMEKDSKDSMKKETGEVMMEKTDEGMITDSRYVAYSSTALEKASTGKTVLFFYASWCPTCKPADADFEENANTLPKDVTVIRVNYNDPDTDQEEKDLAKKYGITYQHTFVQIDGEGKEIAKWNGGKSAELLKNIK
jgi:thiol-disulfide isomerase/thioredoxin